MSTNLKNSNDLDVIRWIAANDNNKLGAVCRVLLHLVDATADKDANMRPKLRTTSGRSRITAQHRAEIVASVEKPSKLMKRFVITFSTLRSIKTGTGVYRPSGGSKDNWHLYKGRHAAECVRLNGEDSHIRRLPYTTEERILDIATSPEAPTALIRRYQCSMVHIRAVKRGYGRHHDKGGSEANWLGYYSQHRDEIDGLLHDREGGV